MKLNRIFEKVLNFLSEYENRQENLKHIYEMSNLQKRTSGLPVNLWLDDEGTWIDTKHNLMRLKFQNDTDERINRHNMYPMSISEDPKILKGKSNIKLASKDIQEIRNFIINNKALLEKLSLQEINFQEFIESMREK
jgi:hypothetical protein